jgi:hypothetical protein
MSEEIKMVLFYFTVGVIVLIIGMILDEARNN